MTQECYIAYLTLDKMIGGTALRNGKKESIGWFTAKYSLMWNDQSGHCGEVFLSHGWGILIINVT